MIITKKEFDIICVNQNKKNFRLCINFGTREVDVVIKGNVAILNKKGKVPLNAKVKGNYCYLVKRDGIYPIAFFSKDTNTFYRLIPTQDWPSLSLSSVPMHRVRLFSPRKDTYTKIAFLNPWGVVLDTCMGLGYTALLASFKSKKIYTFEKDRNVYFLAKLNPISQPLFSSPKTIIKLADVRRYIKRFQDDYFDCIIHDPPTFKIAPELYSQEFYTQLLRVLKPGGRMFHYTPLYGIMRRRNFPLKIKHNVEEVSYQGKNRVSRFSVLTLDIYKGGLLCQKLTFKR